MESILRAGYSAFYVDTEARSEIKNVRWMEGWGHLPAIPVSIHSIMSTTSSCESPVK